MTEENCVNCGRPDSDHRDDWGRYVACVEQIMDTVAFHEAELDEHWQPHWHGDRDSDKPDDTPDYAR